MTINEFIADHAYLVMARLSDHYGQSADSDQVPFQTAAIGGSLVDGGGQPLSAQSVALKTNGSVVSQTVTDDNGFFSVSAPPGVYDVEVSGEIGDPTSYDVTVPGVDLTALRRGTFALPAESVSVVVTGPGGSPIPHARLQMSCVSTSFALLGGTASGSECTSETTDASGHAVMTLLPASTVQLSVTPPAGSRLASRNVQFTPSNGLTLSVHLASLPTPPLHASTGYWMVASAGSVASFGNARFYGSAHTSSVTHIAATPSGHGYWVVNAIGQVFAFGDAIWSGNASALSSGEIVPSLSPSPTGRGYWLFTSKGRVLRFGDAHFFGDMSGTSLNGRVVDAVATPTGNGYYLVASDGGIFAFGDARFHGSMGGTRLNQPVRGLVPTVDNRGYWLAAADGGVFSFGDARFRGSMGGKHLNRPICGTVRYGNGYLMAAADGGIFDFSNQRFFGAAHLPGSVIVSVAAN